MEETDPQGSTNSNLAGEPLCPHPTPKDICSSNRPWEISFFLQHHLWAQNLIDSWRGSWQLFQLYRQTNSANFTDLWLRLLSTSNLGPTAPSERLWGSVGIFCRDLILQQSFNDTQRHLCGTEKIDTICSCNMLPNSLSSCYYCCCFCCWSSTNRNAGKCRNHLCKSKEVRQDSHFIPLID